MTARDSYDEWYVAMQQRSDAWDAHERELLNDRIDAALAKAKPKADPLSLKVQACERINDEWKIVEAALVDQQCPEQIVLPIKGQITSHMLFDVKMLLTRNVNAKSIVVEIDSEGGYLEPSEHIYAHIVAHRAADKIAVVTGMCHSAAELPLLACAQRVALPEATFCSHPAWGESDAACKAADKFIQLIADIRGVDMGAYRELFELGEHYDAATAKAIGLIHDVAEEPDVKRAQVSASVQASAGWMGFVGLTGVIASGRYDLNRIPEGARPLVEDLLVSRGIDQDGLRKLWSEQ